MKSIKAEKIATKKIEYKDKNTGEPKSFIKYGVKSGDIWYELKGKGKETAKEGDTLIGEYTTQDWESNGKTGTNHILTLIDTTLANIIVRLDRLEAYVYTKENVGADELPDIDENSDLPF